MHELFYFLQGCRGHHFCTGQQWQASDVSGKGRAGAAAGPCWWVVPSPVLVCGSYTEELVGAQLICIECSLVPRPSITANAVEGLVKLLCIMTSGERLEAWFIVPCTGVHWKCHASRHPPVVILHRSFTRLSTMLAVIEGLGTRLYWLLSSPPHHTTMEQGETCRIAREAIHHMYTDTTHASRFTHHTLTNRIAEIL